MLDKLQEILSYLVTAAIVLSFIVLPIVTNLGSIIIGAVAFGVVFGLVALFFKHC